jgi:hypothetical protein
MLEDDNFIQNVLMTEGIEPAPSSSTDDLQQTTMSAASDETILYMLGNFEIVEIDGVVFVRVKINQKTCYKPEPPEPPCPPGEDCGGPCPPGSDCGPPPPPSCIEENISCFKPESGKYYILTGWIYEDVEQTSPLAGQGEVQLVFSYSSGPATVFTARMRAEDPLIDGWKRVFLRFAAPGNFSDLTIRLKSSNDFDIYYDDIRFHPEDGTMQSFVYDPVNLRLTSTLDENNYATFYEYDNEGKLVRVKKETVRGIMTIRESRENMSSK